VTYRCEHLCILLRVHRRSKYLRDIFKQISQLSKGRKTTVIVRSDRPSVEVISSLDRIEQDLEDNITMNFFEARSRTRSSSGELWGLSCKEIHAEMNQLEDVPGIAMLWDDDVLFTTESLQEVKDYLSFIETDRIDIRWAMCHGSTIIENTTFPQHWATCAFRVIPGDAWSDTLIQHAPEAASLGTSKRISSPALHLGYLTEDDREDAWLSAKASGKLDSHSYALIRPPQLKELNHGQAK